MSIKSENTPASMPCSFSLFLLFLRKDPFLSEFSISCVLVLKDFSPSDIPAHCTILNFSFSTRIYRIYRHDLVCPVLFIIPLTLHFPSNKSISLFLFTASFLKNYLSSLYSLISYSFFEHSNKISPFHYCYSF